MNSKYLLPAFSFFFYSFLFSQTSDSIAKGPEKGSLLIVGGGELGDDIWNKFIDLAGGKNASILVVPTAAGNNEMAVGENTARRLKSMGIENVSVLHTTDPKEADGEEFAEPVQKATGIWFTGGRHWRLADSYLDTRTHREFEKLLERGGVIGGTSAGATIQGSFMVRGDTKGNTIMIGDHTEGLGFFKNVTIDQHVMARNRQFDLVPVIEKYPHLLGFGIDEGTAIVVRGDSISVIGKSYVAVVDANRWKEQKEKDGKITQPFFYLGNGQRLNLTNRKIITGE